MRSTLLAWLVLLASLLVSPSVASAAGPGWSVEPAPAWVVPVAPAPAEGGAPPADTNGGRYLLYDRQTRIDGVTVESYTRWSRQITNEAGLTGTSQLSVDFDPSYETLALHSVLVRRGGETFDRLTREAVKLVQREPKLEAQVFDGRQSAVLFVSDLRVGDTVEFAFTLRGADPTLRGHYAGAFLFGAPEPIARMHARLVVAGGRPVRLLAHAPDGNRSPYATAPVAHAGVTEYEWDFRGVQAHPDEPSVPSWHPAYPWVQISDFDSWNEVAALGVKLFHVATPVRGALFDWVTKTRRETPSNDEFLLRAIRFVQDEIRYVAIEVGLARRSPTDPTVVFERRYGDCKDKTALLVSILQLAGMDARPTLVSTTQGHALDEWSPTSDVFDHAIVRVAVGAEVYWVDPTISLQGGGLDRQRFSPYERALTLDERSTGLESPPLAPADRPSAWIRDHYQVALPDSKDDTFLDSERVYEGETADGVRNDLASKTPDEIAKYFLSLYQGDFPMIRAAEPLERTDDRAHDTLTIKAHFALPKFWTFSPSQARNESSLTARFIENILQRPPNAARTAPLGIPFPLHVRQEIDLDLPFELTMTPATTKVGDKAFELTFSSAYGKKHLNYTYDLTTRVPAVAAPDVAAHLQKVDDARAQLARTLTYRPTQPDGINWAVFAVLTGCFPFLAFGAYRAYRHDPKRPAPTVSPDPALSGYRGWLILLLINIVQIVPGRLYGFVKEASVALSLATWRSLTTPELETYSPGAATLLACGALLTLATAVYAPVVTVLFFQKRRTFPLHFTVYMVGWVTLKFLDVAQADLIATNSQSPLAVILVFPTLVAATLWIGYVHRSERVAATFVERGPWRKPRRVRKL